MKLQKIGAGLLVAALVLTWVCETGFAYLCLLTAGIIDIVLFTKEAQTISQWIQDLWPKKIDYPILIVLSIFTFSLFFKQFGFIVGMQAILPLLMFFLLLHLFANKD